MAQGTFSHNRVHAEWLIVPPPFAAGGTNAASFLNPASLSCPSGVGLSLKCATQMFKWPSAGASTPSRCRCTLFSLRACNQLLMLPMLFFFFHPLSQIWPRPALFFHPMKGSLHFFGCHHWKWQNSDRFDSHGEKKKEMLHSVSAVASWDTGNPTQRLFDRRVTIFALTWRQIIYYAHKHEFFIICKEWLIFLQATEELTCLHVLNLHVRIIIWRHLRALDWDQFGCSNTL